MEEFVIGGQKPGKRGRGADGQASVAAEVEKKVKKPGRIRLQVAPDCSGDVLMSCPSINGQFARYLHVSCWMQVSSIVIHGQA
ncbi:hypothetical protein [Desulfosarcina alkanivorans]|uniref:hypothetical protein n=1 Tax=Desulfosarcina alkanivorans TaxID=571177 RepID=UPI0012D33BA9|nr:hypothetical protein [Desulfosarcina alkanivorans]